MRISLCEILISSFPCTMLSHLMGQLQLLCGAVWSCVEPPGLQPGRYELPWVSVVSPTLSVGLNCGPKKLGIRISLCEILISSFPWTMLSHLMGHVVLPPGTLLLAGFA